MGTLLRAARRRLSAAGAVSTPAGRPVSGRADSEGAGAEGAGSDRGETLIELLFTIVVTGLTVVAVLGALASVITLSSLHRKQATAGGYLRAFAAALEASVAASPTGYTPCATTATYAGVYSVAAPYAASITAVAYWNGTSSFVGTCGTDVGVQRVSLRVRTTDNKVSETLDVIIRKPCRPTADFPSDTLCS